MGILDLKNFKLQLQVVNLTLFPGNLLMGYAFIEAKKDVKIRTVKITITGTEKFKIRENRSVDGWVGFTKTSIEESATVFSTSLLLAGMEENGEFVIQAGRYKYPFAMTLPFTLPPTMHFDSHAIRSDVTYKVKVVVEIPWGMDATEELPIRVLAMVPQAHVVNELPAHVSELRDSVTKCCCFDKGDMHIRASLHQTYLAIGRDAVRLVLEIDNQSEYILDEVRIGLEAICTIHSYPSNPNSRYEIMKHKERVNIGSNQQGRAEFHFVVPSGIVPACVSSLFRVEHCLGISFNMNSGSFCEEMKITIIPVHEFDPTNTVGLWPFLARGTFDESLAAMYLDKIHQMDGVFAYPPPPMQTADYTPISGPQPNVPPYILPNPIEGFLTPTEELKNMPLGTEKKIEYQEVRCQATEMLRVDPHSRDDENLSTSLLSNPPYSAPMH